MPIRYWDHELGDESPRLLLQLGGRRAARPRRRRDDRTGRGAYSISADGATVATAWRTPPARRRRADAVAVIDVAVRRARASCAPRTAGSTSRPGHLAGRSRVALAQRAGGHLRAAVAGELRIVAGRRRRGRSRVDARRHLTRPSGPGRPTAATLFVERRPARTRRGARRRSGERSRSQPAGRRCRLLQPVPGTGRVGAVRAALGDRRRTAPRSGSTRRVDRQTAVPLASPAPTPRAAR